MNFVECKECKGWKDKQADPVTHVTLTSWPPIGVWGEDAEGDQWFGFGHLCPPRSEQVLLRRNECRRKATVEILKYRWPWVTSSLPNGDPPWLPEDEYERD